MSMNQVTRRFFGEQDNRPPRKVPPMQVRTTIRRQYKGFEILVETSCGQRSVRPDPTLPVISKSTGQGGCRIRLSRGGETLATKRFSADNLEHVESEYQRLIQSL